MTTPLDSRTPVIDAAAHAWVVRDPRFPMDPAVATCPDNMPNIDESAEHLIARMATYGIDQTVISHVCYYGRDNNYTTHCVNEFPKKFTGVGLLVGYRLHSPDDPENPARLERLMNEDGLSGLRLSPIYDPDVVWMNDVVSYPLWRKAEELGAAFNVFAAPHQVAQIDDMAARFPGVNVVVDHFAMIDITRPDSEGFEQLLKLNRHPNVFIRTSLHNPSRQELPYRDMWPYLERAYDAFGPRKLIYASDYELLVMKDLIPFFTTDDKKWILGGNAFTVYRDSVRR
ncbi:MAG: amidohydrolase family protein [Chloroflexi bacterium]|nr:amidohydrolase family protein [Chloroflexota bacterium]